MGRMTDRVEQLSHMEEDLFPGIGRTFLCGLVFRYLLFNLNSIGLIEGPGICQILSS